MKFKHMNPLRQSVFTAALVAMTSFFAFAEEGDSAISSKEIVSRTIEDGGTGPHKAIMVSDESLPTHTIFRPRELDARGDKGKLPIVAWGNGACANSPWEHVNFLSEIAFEA